MRFIHTRPLLGAVAAMTMLGGTVLGLAASASAGTAGPAISGPVLVNCAGHGQVKPASHVLACGDGGAVLTKMVWTQWSAQALGTGAEEVNNCVPTCVGGTFKPYKVITVLWRQEARKSPNSGQAYTRATIIYTGQVPKGSTRSTTVVLSQ
jgi:hypothetical protein